MEKYEIVVEGTIPRLGEEWMLEADTKISPDGTTKISGYVQDRAALYGIFARMRDLGLKIIKVERRDEEK